MVSLHMQMHMDNAVRVLGPRRRTTRSSHPSGNAFLTRLNAGLKRYSISPPQCALFRVTARLERVVRPSKCTFGMFISIESRGHAYSRRRAVRFPTHSWRSDSCFPLSAEYQFLRSDRRFDFDNLNAKKRGVRIVVRD